MRKLADLRRGHAFDQRHFARVETEPAQELQVAGSALAEVESRPGHHHPGSDPDQVLTREVGRLEAGDLRSELDDQDVLHAGSLEELQTALQGCQQLDPPAEHGARMRMERDDGRGQVAAAARVDGRLNDRPMAEMDAVERPDRNRAWADRTSSAAERATFTRLPRRSAGPSASTPARTASVTRSSASAGRRASAVSGRQQLCVLDRARLIDAERADGGPSQSRAVAVERAVRSSGRRCPN